MLNNLIGANAPDVAGPDRGDDGDKVESKRITEVERRTQSGTTGAARKSSVGELSKDNIKILSDERTNALIIMASRGEQAVLREIIADMDMMLSQVLIEVVILEIALSDSLQTGVDWIQRSLTSYRGTGTERAPTVSWAGGGGGGRETPIALTLPNAGGATLSTAGMRYYMSFFDLNLDVVISMAASDGRSRVVSTPVLLTTDNTEAKLESTDRIYVYDSTTRRSDINGGDFETYKQEDVGLKLEIKPHINVNNVVMLEISQELSQPNPNPPGNVDNLAGQLISRKREIEASVAVASGNTIVLGGQVREDNNRDRSKVPFLGDIPLLGRLFTYNARSKNRTETVVFMTPYVLDSPEKIEEESRRRRDALDAGGMWKQGWSNSRLAEPPKKSSKWWPFGSDATATTPTAPERVVPTSASVDATSQSLPGELNHFLQEQEERWREAERRGGLRP
jgi:general secretion pathway protein D